VKLEDPGSNPRACNLEKLLLEIKVALIYTLDKRQSLHAKHLEKIKFYYLIIFYHLLAEVPGAARVILQPAEHLINVSFSF